MRHERWWSFHRPWLECPSKIAPQPVREASVVSILRRHEAPNMGPWDSNQGFFHIIKARKHRRMTLIMRKGLPFGENPLVLSHHCRGLMYNSPKGIMLAAAAIRPNSLWNCLTVSDWSCLILFTADRMDSIRAGDRRACIDVESNAMPRKVVLCSGESTLFLAFSRNTISFMWARTTSRCQTANWCDWARVHYANTLKTKRNLWKCRVIILGRTGEPGTLVCSAPKSKPQELPVIWKDGYVEVCVLENYRDKPILGSDLCHDLSQS